MKDLIEYKNLNGDSKISYYKVENNAIIVKYKNQPNEFIYNDIQHLNQLKKLAEQGKGLNHYIVENRPIVKIVN